MAIFTSMNIGEFVVTAPTGRPWDFIVDCRWYTEDQELQVAALRAVMQTAVDCLETREKGNSDD